MSFRGDERAVSTVVGAVLVFAILILALGGYQAQIVPAQNERVEYEHSQTVGNQIQDLRNALVGTAATGNPRPASVTLGMRYPSRTFTVNPPPPDGRLQGVAFENRSNVTIANVRATNDETADYLNGSLNFSTDGIEYIPDYNEFRNAPTTRYEHGTLYDAYEEGDIERTGGIVVDDGVITLVTLNVSEGFRESGTDSVSVDPRALSAPYQSTRINNSGGNITLTLPTAADRNGSMWERMYETNPDVANVSQREGAVTLTLNNDSYELRMAHLGIGSGPDRPGAEYLTLVRGEGTDRVTVEVRDRYNNPVPWTVNVSNDTDIDNPFKQSNISTGSDGQATFVVAENNTIEETRLEIRNGNSEKEYVDVSVSTETTTPRGEIETYNVNLTASELECASPGHCTMNTSGSEFSTPLSANVTVDGMPLTGAQVDFALNNTSVGSLSPGDNETEGGISTSTFTASVTEGVVTVYAATGDGSDRVTIRVVGDESNDPNAIQFSNLQNFEADAVNDQFTVGHVQVQDADNDDDLETVEYTIRNSSGTVVATRTETGLSGDQYQVQSYIINDSVQVASGEVYTLTVTARDADGNYISKTQKDSTPSLMFEYNYDGGGTTAIPPTDPRGVINNPGRVLVDDGSEATVETNYYNDLGSQYFSVGFTAPNVQSANAYEFEMQYRFYSGGNPPIDAKIVRSDGTVLQTISLDTSQTNVDSDVYDLKADARAYVKDNGTFHVVFEKASPGDYTQFLIDYLELAPA